MAEKEKSGVQRWPNWAQPATKGDVIRAAVFSRSVTIKLGLTIAAVMAGDKEKAAERWKEYVSENEELMRILDDIGNS